MNKWHIRTISKDGTIRLLGKKWRPKRGDATHLYGYQMTFGDYRPYEKNLLNLWGSASSFYWNDPESEIGKLLYKADCELLGNKVEGDSFNVGSGSYHMNREAGKFVAYRSRGIDFWEPIPTKPKKSTGLAC